MSVLNDGAGGYGAILLAGVLTTEIWRWLGVLVGSRLAVDGAVFQWVRAVATSLVAAMVARMLLYPAGTLASVPWQLRLGAFVAGVACYFAARRSLGAGVACGALILLAAEALRT